MISYIIHEMQGPGHTSLRSRHITPWLHTILKQYAIYHFFCYIAKKKLQGTSRGFFLKLYTMLYNIKNCYDTKKCCIIAPPWAEKGSSVIYHVKYHV